VFENAGKETLDRVEVDIPAWLELLKQTVAEVREDTELVIEVPGPIRIYFKRKEQVDASHNSTVSDGVGPSPVVAGRA
jgi:hypothetical protein